MNIQVLADKPHHGECWRSVGNWDNLQHLLRALKNNSYNVKAIKDTRGVIIIIGDQDES